MKGWVLPLEGWGLPYEGVGIKNDRYVPRNPGTPNSLEGYPGNMSPGVRKA